MRGDRIRTLQRTRPAWLPFAGASLHWDFRNRQYYWGGRQRQESEFTAFFGAEFSNFGLFGDGSAAGYDIRLNFSDTGLTVPFNVICSFIPVNVNSVAGVALGLGLDNSNQFTLGLSASNTGHSLTQTAGATVANQAAVTAINEAKMTLGANIETNNQLQSVNGATGGAADTVVSYFAFANIRALEKESSGGTGLPCHLAHVVMIAGALTQANLNAQCGAVHAL